MYSDWRMFSRSGYMPLKAIMLPLIDTLRRENLLPALTFCFSRKKCEKMARSITTSLNTAEEGSNVERVMNKAVYQLENPKAYTESDDASK